MLHYWSQSNYLFLEFDLVERVCKIFWNNKSTSTTKHDTSKNSSHITNLKWNITSKSNNNNSRGNITSFSGTDGEFNRFFEAMLTDYMRSQTRVDDREAGSVYTSRVQNKFSLRLALNPRIPPRSLAHPSTRTLDMCFKGLTTMEVGFSVKKV